MIVDKSVVPGAGAFQISCSEHLLTQVNKGLIKGKARFGVRAFAEALLIIPKTLAANSGHDIQDCREWNTIGLVTVLLLTPCLVAALHDELQEGNIVGLNLISGEPMDPIQEGVYDSFRVLRNCVASSSGIASNLLLCDELLKARQMVGARRFLAEKSVNFT